MDYGTLGTLAGTCTKANVMSDSPPLHLSAGPGPDALAPAAYRLNRGVQFEKHGLLRARGHSFYTGEISLSDANVWNNHVQCGGLESKKIEPSGSPATAL